MAAFFEAIPAGVWTLLATVLAALAAAFASVLVARRSGRSQDVTAQTQKESSATEAWRALYLQLRAERQELLERVDKLEQGQTTLEQRLTASEARAEHFEVLAGRTEARAALIFDALMLAHDWIDQAPASSIPKPVRPSFPKGTP